MKFVNDRQRRAVFSKLNRDSPDNKFCIGLYILSDLTLKEKEKLEKQYKKGKNEFALYQTKGGRVRSTEIPSVDFELVDSAKMTDPSYAKLSGILSDVDESHLAGLDYLIVVPPKDPMVGKKFLGVYKERDTGKAAIITDPTDEVGMDEIASHELGHHITRSNLGSKNIKHIGKYGQEILADEYMSDFTGKDNRYVRPEEEQNAEEALSYATALQELKNPSIKDQSKYADIKFSNDAQRQKWLDDVRHLEDMLDSGMMSYTQYSKELEKSKHDTLGIKGDTKFSFSDRKHKGWYPAGSNLPNEFPDIVRGIAMDIILKDHNYTNPDDDIQVSRMTGEVCRELDKVWKSEWGKRPDEHYLKADVKDAFEDLD